MLIPAPESEHATQPRPWGTYVLLALCILVFIPVHFAHRSNMLRGVRMLDEAVAFYGEHPYLELDPRLQQVLWRGNGSGVEGGEAAWRKTMGVGQSTGLKLENLEQAKLDSLTGAGIDVLSRLPHWRWGVVPGDLSLRSLVGHMFLHAAWVPLAANLVFLWFAGSFLEARRSTAMLVGCFLASGVVAAGVFLVKYPTFPMPLCGASAATAGLVGAVAVFWGAGRLPFRYWLGSERTGEVVVPALALVGVWGLREALVLVSPEVLVPGGALVGTEYWNHFAGFGTGAAVAAGMRFRERRGRPASEAPTPKQKKAPDAVSAQTVALARAAWEEGRTGEAWNMLRGAVRVSPKNTEAVDTFWALALEEGRAPEAAPAVVRWVHQHGRGEELAEAHRRWREVREKAPGVSIPVATELRLGTALQAAGKTGAATEVLAVAAAQVGPRELPGNLAQLAKHLVGSEQARVARMALDHPDLPPARRVEMEALVSAAEVAPARREVARDEEEPHPVETTTETAAPPLDVMYAVPLGIQKGNLGIEMEGGARRVLPLNRIRGVAGAQVYDGGVEPDYMLDLVLEFPRGDDARASVIRFHCERFDPRKLVPTEAEVGDALLSLAGQLLTAGGGTWLLGAHPTELRSYDSPGEHQRELLSILRLNAGAG